jgi:hypothetical protein
MWAVFWIAGGIACLVLRERRWVAPLWVFVTTPAVALLLIVVFAVLAAFADSGSGPDSGWIGMEVLFMLLAAIPLGFFALLLVASCPPRSAWHLRATLLCIPAVLASVAMSVGAAYASLESAKPPRSVELLIPDGFTGRIFIREDPQQGVPPERVGGVTRYLIPKSGRLTTTDIQPFRTWHRNLARYANGEEIPEASEPVDKGPLLFSSGSFGVEMFFVGTRAEYFALSNKDFAAPDPWEE